jgi:hypothetical protein
MMVAIVIAVAALVAIGGFLYILSAVIGENNHEREQITEYFSDLLIQANLQFQSERDAWAQERASLLERIQRPDMIPPTPVLGDPVPANEIVDDLHLGGSIRESDAPPPPDDDAA